MDISISNAIIKKVNQIRYSFLITRYLPIGTQA